MLRPSDLPPEARDGSTESPFTSSPMAKRPSPPRKPRVTKLFVLDTNVLMHDPTSLFRFEEHDVYLPIGTLEELDNHKKGLSDVARNARQASRFLDEIVSSQVADISAGIPLVARADVSTFRPRRSTASFPRLSPPARPTTRSSRW